MGHYGRTKIIKLKIDMDLVGKALAEIDKIQESLNYKPVFLKTNRSKLKNNIFKKLI